MERHHQLEHHIAVSGLDDADIAPAAEAASDVKPHVGAVIGNKNEDPEPHPYREAVCGIRPIAPATVCTR
ncbi:MAG: hypothetical protein Rubg2KO_29140 [Rubricoccaceae bacterium]